MSIAEFVMIFGDFIEEWLETPKCWKWRSFMKVIIPIVVHRNSSYDELVVRVMQSDNLDYVPGDMVISYLMNLREKVNPTIINSDAVDDDFSDYENDDDQPINTEDDPMHMEEVSSN
ncbi:hypothetical protein BC332_21159 [Capsicum chinense]|nr:hypothetical protein BC332_21159 [Capsicum chinense]